MKRLAVFLSGGGSNFRKIHEAVLAGDIPGEVPLVVTTNTDCPGAKYARSHWIEVVRFPVPERSPEDLLVLLKSRNIDFVILAGYLKMVPSEVVAAYHRAILNIHPALLPKFGGQGYYGRKVHAAVIEAGETQSGPTVHFVDEQYDHGPTVAQVSVPVLPDDTPETLADRVLEQEHRLYPQVVAALCHGHIHWTNDGRPAIDPPLDVENLL